MLLLNHRERGDALCSPCDGAYHHACTALRSPSIVGAIPCGRPVPCARPVTGPIQLALSFANKVYKDRLCTPPGTISNHLATVNDPVHARQADCGGSYGYYL
jgi:hypothetical protein